MLLARWRPLPCVLVLTSRIASEDDRERVLELGPLAEEDALALLRARFAEVGGPPIDPGAGADLARALDCLPLALELAAGWAGLLGPDEMLALAPQVLLRKIDSTNEPQDTIDESLARSWSLLPETVRRVLMDCATFCGGFDLAAAKGVTGQTTAALLDALETLRRQGLIRRDAVSARPFYLYHLVRDFVRRTHSSDDAFARHGAWALSFAEASADNSALDLHLPDLRQARAHSPEAVFVA